MGESTRESMRRLCAHSAELEGACLPRWRSKVFERLWIAPSLSAIAKALGLRESDLAIDPEDYLTLDERERLRIGPEADS